VHSVVTNRAVVLTKESRENRKGLGMLSPAFAALVSRKEGAPTARHILAKRNIDLQILLVGGK
jgi:hypothetical protein